jgi:hypothetical protein
VHLVRFYASVSFKETFRSGSFCYGKTSVDEKCSLKKMKTEVCFLKQTSTHFRSIQFAELAFRQFDNRRLRQAVRDLAKLWDGKDEASPDLMKRFYEGILKQGMPSRLPTTP